MASQVLGAVSNQSSAGQPVTGQPPAGQPVTERPARFLPGLRMLALCIVFLVAGVVLAVLAGHDHGGVAKAVVLLCALCFVVGSVMLCGLAAVAPGQAVVQLFGKYRGTVRESGLQWVRVRPTGVDIIESRLTRLSYAPRSPRPCCASSRPARSSARGSA